MKTQEEQLSADYVKGKINAKFSLFLIEHNAIKMYGEVEVQVYVFLTQLQMEVSVQNQATAAFEVGKNSPVHN